MGVEMFINSTDPPYQRAPATHRHDRCLPDRRTHRHPGRLRRHLCLFVLHRAHILAPPQDPAAVDLRDLWRRTSPFFTLSIAEVLQQRIDILLLSIVAGPAVTGIYSAAYNLVRILVKLIQSFWQALYPTLSRLHHESSPRYQILSDLSLRYGLIVLLPAPPLRRRRAELIRLVYTEEYAASAPVLQLADLDHAAPLCRDVRRHPAHGAAPCPQQRLRVIGVTSSPCSLPCHWRPPAYGAIGAAWASVLAAAAGAARRTACAPSSRHPLPPQQVGLDCGSRHWSRLAGSAAARCIGSHARLIAAVAYLAIVWFSRRILRQPTLDLIRRVLRPDSQ